MIVSFLQTFAPPMSSPPQFCFWSMSTICYAKDSGSNAPKVFVNCQKKVKEQMEKNK